MKVGIEFAFLLLFAVGSNAKYGAIARLLCCDAFTVVAYVSPTGQSGPGCGLQGEDFGVSGCPVFRFRRLRIAQKMRGVLSWPLAQFGDSDQGAGRFSA